MPDTATVIIAITTPEGRRLTERRERCAKLHQRRTLLLGSPSHDLALGRYRIVVRLLGSSGPAAGFLIRLERAESR